MLAINHIFFIVMRITEFDKFGNVPEICRYHPSQVTSQCFVKYEYASEYRFIICFLFLNRLYILLGTFAKILNIITWDKGHETT